MNTYSDNLMSSLARLVAGESIPLREYEVMVNSALITSETRVAVDGISELGGGELEHQTYVEITQRGREHLEDYLKRRGAL